MRRWNGARRAVAACLLLFSLAFLAAWAIALLSGGIWPEASGDKLLTKGSLVIDASHSESGYIMVKSEKTDRRLKLRISKEDPVTREKVTLDYDLNGEGLYEVFPLQMGSGSYTCALYKNVDGMQYSAAGTVTVKAELTDDNIAFLSPNQYVNYTPETPAVLEAAALCEGLTTQREKADAIFDYIRDGFVYDFVKAMTVAGALGEMPNIDQCFKTRMGICQDLSALTACMLRTQGIPTQLVIGYANNGYHAWNRIYLDGEYILFDATAELNAISKDVVYSMERIY
ncbi:MAG: transglutaminase-like domain-containing protein [Oscillospiraceae bacterium]|jgi:transglutaminase-like putative cysteine protease|nr:transglutaminase-like domain-containing protein [Oscillospiraceae bacterium]